MKNVLEKALTEGLKVRISHPPKDNKEKTAEDKIELSSEDLMFNSLWKDKESWEIDNNEHENKKRNVCLLPFTRNPTISNLACTDMPNEFLKPRL
jgi:hypothetical protein